MEMREDGGDKRDVERRRVESELIKPTEAIDHPSEDEHTTKSSLLERIQIGLTGEKQSSLT